MPTKSKCLYLAIVLIIANVVCVYAQRNNRNTTYLNYVVMHSKEAMKQMDKYGVPASITMAQGLLETGGGTSSLAVEHNNHFGIKCHSSWRGKRTYHDDDLKQECFRSYGHWEESYTDHSVFLKQKRYNRLWQLDPTDYKGWARGLQACGYATNKGYANRLIKIVEDYELYTLDQGAYPSWFDGGVSYRDKVTNKRKPQKTTSQQPLRDCYLSYGLLYTLAKEGDTFRSIAQEMDMNAAKIAKYNDAPMDFALRSGDVVYLDPKNNMATPPHYTYVVKVGDSMHSIAQRFGIKMEKLYKMNDKDDEYLPIEGDVLRLR